MAACTAQIVESVEDAYYFIHVHLETGETEMKIENPVYTVSLDRTNGTRLGLKLDVQTATRSLFIKEVIGGLAFQYNASVTEGKVKPGDRIVRVNNVENDAPAMLEECKKKEVLELEIHRGAAIPILPGLSATVKASFCNYTEGMQGAVAKVDDDGDSLLNIQGSVLQWVCKADYDKFKFEDNDRYYFKRFVDFKDLHLALKQKIDTGGESPISKLPELPKDESFGFRRHLSALGMSSFMAERKEGLQKALNLLLSQVNLLEDEPLINEFFGKSPLPQVGAAKEDMLKERLDVLVLKHVDVVSPV